MHSLESHNSLDTIKASCVIANTNNDIHDIGENRMSATPSFKMNQNIVPVRFTPLHETILVDHLLVNPIFN